MPIARFMAKLEEPLIMRAQHVEVTMTVKPSSFPGVLKLVLFTGAGKLPPRAFSIRIASRAVPGMVCTAWLHELTIGAEASTKAILRLEKAEYKTLNGLMNKMVGVEVKDERSASE